MNTSTDMFIPEENNYKYLFTPYQLNDLTRELLLSKDISSITWIKIKLTY